MASNAAKFGAEVLERQVYRQAVRVFTQHLARGVKQWFTGRAHQHDLRLAGLCGESGHRFVLT